MSRKRRHLTLAATLLLTVAALGCGKKGLVSATPDATAQAFAAALEAGQYERAATTFDYTTDARKQFEDWDSLPSSQRELITRRTREQKPEELKAVKQRLGSGLKAGRVFMVTGGGGEIRSVAGAGGSVGLQLIQRDGKWFIANLW